MYLYPVSHGKLRRRKRQSRETRQKISRALLAWHRKQSRKQPKPTPEEKQARARSLRLLREHGISWEDLARIQAWQGGVCAICRRAKTLWIDHDPESHLIRGLLCLTCWYKVRAPEVPQNIAGYIQNPPVHAEWAPSSFDSVGRVLNWYQVLRAK